MKQRFANHVGNRGSALALLGVLWILTGVGLVVAPLDRAQLIDERLPVWFRAVLWIGPGALAVIASGWRRFDADAWGWLMVPAVVRFVSFFAGWICSLIGYERWAYPDGWRGATTLAIFIAFLSVCARGLDRPALPADPRPEA